MIREATINTSANFGTYTFNPNMSEFDGNLADWIASTEENTEINGRLEGQDGGKVFKCSMSDDEFVNVVVWESAE